MGVIFYLSHSSIAVRRHQTKASYKRKYLLGGFSEDEAVDIPVGSSRQAAWLEQYLRVHFWLKSCRQRDRNWACQELLKLQKPTPRRTRSKKTTSNLAQTVAQIETHESMGATLIQTSTHSLKHCDVLPAEEWTPRRHLGVRRSLVLL